MIKIFCVIILFYSSFFYAQDKPDFSLTAIDNKEINVKSVYEKGPLLISFWALWCEPCKVEMRALESIYKKYKDEGLTILGINQDSPKSVSKVRSYISSQKISFLIALDPNNQYLQKMNGSSIPYSLLYDTNGKVIYKHVGYLPGDEVELEKQIQKLLPDTR